MLSRSGAQAGMLQLGKTGFIGALEATIVPKISQVMQNVV